MGLWADAILGWALDKASPKVREERGWLFADFATTFQPRRDQGGSSRIAPNLPTQLMLRARLV